MDKIIISVIAKYSVKKDISTTSIFSDIGVDWLSSFMILLECERIFNIDIEETDLCFISVDDFINFIKSKLTYKNTDKIN